MSVQLSPNANWQRIEHRAGTKPASREDILKVLSNIDAILIRAQLSSDTASTSISDITLDTAIDANNGQPRATNVEVCKCPTVRYSSTFFFLISFLPTIYLFFSRAIAERLAKHVRLVFIETPRIFL